MKTSPVFGGTENFSMDFVPKTSITSCQKGCLKQIVGFIRVGPMTNCSAAGQATIFRKLLFKKTKKVLTVELKTIRKKAEKKLKKRGAQH